MRFHENLFRRMGQGYASQAAVAAQNGFVALYNNDRIGRMIAVLDFEGHPTTNNPLIVSVVRGTLGALASSGLSYIPGEYAPSGQIYSGTAAALPAANTVNIVSSQALDAWNHEFPASILPQGYSLAIYDKVVNEIIEVSFTWAILEAEDLTP